MRPSFYEMTVGKPQVVTSSSGMSMAIAGVNFAFYWRAMRGDSIWPQAAEVRLYLLILLLSIGAVTASLALADDGATIGRSLRDAAFAVTSVMTSTGFTTAYFDSWSDYARAHLLLIVFVGGCAGSTAGGMKVIRILLLGKIAGQRSAASCAPSDPGAQNPRTQPLRGHPPRRARLLLPPSPASPRPSVSSAPASAQSA